MKKSTNTGQMSKLHVSVRTYQSARSRKQESQGVGRSAPAWRLRSAATISGVTASIHGVEEETTSQRYDQQQDGLGIRSIVKLLCAWYIILPSRIRPAFFSWPDPACFVLAKIMGPIQTWALGAGPPRHTLEPAPSSSMNPIKPNQRP